MRRARFFSPFLFVLAVFVFFPSDAISSAVGLSLFGGRFEGSVRSVKELRSKNIVRQSLDFSCGPAALATVLNYHFNDRVSELQIIEAMLQTVELAKIKARKGFSLLDLKRYAAGRGYEATGYRMDLVFLTGLKGPVIVPVRVRDFSHFVVVRGVRGGMVYIADPALGNMALSVEKFLDIWKANAGLVLNGGAPDGRLSALGLENEKEPLQTGPLLAQRVLNQGLLGAAIGIGEF